jgi:diaminohydroxyphosphoribosylaminopyrimidine deaminase/5-amino-6-(5-phosphoribosylamino)uracil reductase
MSRAIHLAVPGRGSVEPNPLVGCVIARGGELLGQGRHESFGAPHAEPRALASCTESVAGATAYVNLEPCCHTDKKTPPCVPALIAAKLARVVIGCLDPNPQVAGKGAAQLQAAGIAVTVGVMENQAKQLNAAYFARALFRRPYITLKWAQSADGRVAAAGGKRTLISNPTSLRVIHALRARSDAILVGIRTALCDDPLLIARGVPTPRPLLRVVLDPELRLPPESQLARTAHEHPVIVYCSQRTHQTRPLAVAALLARKIEPVPLPADGEHLSMPDLLADLHARQVTHLLVEPGPKLARSFFDANLADRVWLFRSPTRIDHESAPAAQPVPYPAVAEVELDGDVLTEHLNPAGGVFFAGQPSPDVLLIQEDKVAFPRLVGV